MENSWVHLQKFLKPSSLTHTRRCTRILPFSTAKIRKNSLTPTFTRTPNRAITSAGVVIAMDYLSKKFCSGLDEILPAMPKNLCSLACSSPPRPLILVSSGKYPPSSGNLSSIQQTFLTVLMIRIEDELSFFRWGNGGSKTRPRAPFSAYSFRIAVDGISNAVLFPLK